MPRWHLPAPTHCDPVEPECAFDITSWDGSEGIDGPVLRCQTHGLLAPQEVYEQAFIDGPNIITAKTLKEY